MARERDLASAVVLEIGVGSGVIAAHLAEVVGVEGKVWGVDIRDSRLVTKGFEFVRTEDASLPFDDQSFDVVVSNHVVEHVGARLDQVLHLREIARVLKDDGIAYLATPNRWALVEPHFRLPLLSWLPALLKTPYIRVTRRGSHYDCEPRSHQELLDLFSEAGLEASERTLEAIRLTVEIENVPWLVRRLAEAPSSVHKLLLPLVPTHIFVLRPSRS